MRTALLTEDREPLEPLEPLDVGRWEREESHDIATGCLWGTALGLLLYAVAVAVIIVAIFWR